MSPKVYAPNVHLFAFVLQKAEEKEKDWLWKTCDEIIHKILHEKFNLMQLLDLEKEPDNPTVSLIKADEQTEVAPVEGAVTFDNSSNNSSNNSSKISIHGFAYPLRLYDSYGLWLNLRRPQEENGQRTEDVDIQLLRQLNPENCLLLNGNKNFLGETLIITAWLSSEQDPQNHKALKNLADECLKALFPQSYIIPPFARSDTLFGSPIFEYGLFSQLSNYRHILVWFFSHPEAEEKFGFYQEQLFDLFFFRAKVVEAFRQSRQVYQDTNQEYSKIEEEIKTLEKFGNQQLTECELDQLSEKLKTLPKTALDYANLLRYLEAYQNTIAINSLDYADRLEQIRGMIKDEDISFLEKFSLENCAYFQEQIKADLGYFHHGSSLLDKAIASIRGRVAIDRAKSDRIAEEKKEKSDRNLEITILAVGSAIGSAGIMASSYALVTKEDPVLPPFSTAHPHRFTLSICYSLLFGVVVGILIWGGDKIWQSYKKGTGNREQGTGNKK
ncbi:hypothetical protein DP113_30160 [Brasilonema octagenarum UFV-E1]|uniref:Uncharacterized protein n=1 Tax=Brasilonema sennae CENA114 TaxID=415709 RepID=A0A856MME9_9CYAN|nr:hypothetical protein [Brasilonema sennae]QDL11569.1 hypothetical protein DP114_30005 [Brasilonema sennae CENA114]QDL17949.1 hypothetical protein DP113_30160 [Brasilonema octagenarum UFV-E1]